MPVTSSDPGGELFLRVNEFARSTPWLHGPLITYADYGLLVFAALLLLGWWVARSGTAARMAAALLAPVSTVLAVGLNQPVIKQVGEARPYAVHRGALVLVGKTTDPSFPSDHAAMAGAVAVGLSLVAWQLGLLATGLALVMAFTRVYVGVHYPQDVVAGLALGGLVALVTWAVLRIPVTRLVERLRRSSLRPLVGSAQSPTLAAVA